MRLSEISIERPVLATVMSLLIVVAGAGAFFALPVRELPDVDNPLVSVSTDYPGASPETVEATIVEPLERVLNGIEGIRSIESTSAFGVGSIDVEFEAGRDLDLAATDVSNAVLRAVDRLPDDARRPIVRKAGANSTPIMWINVQGDDYSPEDLTDIADRLVRTPLQLLPGVARAVIGGERRYAMRVWLDPARMAAHGVDALDVRNAIQQSNLQLPAGELEASGRKFTINADALIDDPAEFQRIVIREDDHVPVRIEDVGRVELGSENYQAITRFSARDTVGVGIVRQSRSNELAVSRAVRDALPEIQRAVPEGVDISVAVDFTTYVEVALREVTITLAIACGIVVLVNLLFLHSPTTTAITVAVIPVSLVGTLAVLQALGFSLNVLTLLGLVLSVGLLVDDAIVVQENIYRRQQLGEPPLLAAFNGSREVGFPVIATTVAVVAVLIPLSLMSGDTGRLFREFALCVAVAVSISTFVALTLVPMLCSRFLVVGPPASAVARGIERGMAALSAGYRAALGWCLENRTPVALTLVAFFAGIVLLFQLTPRTFLPLEDRGRIVTVIRAPEGATSAYTRRALAQVEKEMLAVPEIEGFFAAIGMGFGAPSSSSLGMVFTRLQHWDEREVKQRDIVSHLFRRFMGIPEAMVFAINPPSLSRSSRSDLEVVIKSSSASLDEFAEANGAILGRLRETPGLRNVDSDLRVENPQLDIFFDRERAADVGVSVQAVSESLRLLVSQGPADDFVLRNKQYDVVTALASPFRSVPDHLGEVHVRAVGGAMIPLSALIEPRPRTAPSRLSHYDLQRSATFTANLAPGATLGDVLPRVQALVTKELPAGFTTNLRGTSREFVESGAQIYLTFAIALLVIYLVLAAQFESFLHPLTVLFSVPLASLGALLALYSTHKLLNWTHTSLNVYSQIGIILLVGLVTKNSILLVDFANQERARGADLLAALREAGRTRFRPILMTSVTSILGAMPLALASSAGAESRQAIGTAVVGGLLFSTVFTLVMIPVVHYGVIRLAERLGWNTIPPRVELAPIGSEASGP
ncbi:MAG: efflux RND transporter permease subunit [Myxococcota bacterium]|nr:efflux RND transporter permease subunit [Myxococcota bacterium]